MNEEWRSVVGYEGIYSVSSFGRVRSESRGVLTPQVRYGYPNVDLYRNGSVKRHVFIHKLVSAAFLGKRPKGHQVNHIDGVRGNCRVTNLEYCTARENAQHARSVLGSHVGERHGQAKLTDEMVREARVMAASGVTHTVIAVKFGVARQVMTKAISGRTWKHVK